MAEKYGYIVAVENYRKDAWSKVHYAVNDATLMERVFRERFGIPEQNLEVFIDGEATFATMETLFGYSIPNSLNAEVYFYYAGHGFFAEGANYLTAFDTAKDNVLGTSVSVGPLLARTAECAKVVLFLDTCSTDPKEKLQSRGGVADLSRTVFDSVVPKGQCAFYFSCSPGEKAFPCDSLKHGIWTYHLGLALDGKVHEPGLLTENQLMDAPLRNYLYKSVQSYMTEKTSIMQRGQCCGRG